MLIEPKGSGCGDGCQTNNAPVFCNINLCLCETGMAEYSDWVGGGEQRFFCSALCLRWVPRASSTWLKLLGREADHIPPSTAEVKYSLS